MKEFNYRRGRREEIIRFYIRLCGVLLLLVVTVMAMRAAWGMYGKFTSSAQADENAQQNLAQLKTQKEQVSTAVTSLSTPRGVDEQIRERYGVAKPGEGEIQVVHDSPTTTAPVAPQGNFFERIWHAIMPF